MTHYFKYYNSTNVDKTRKKNIYYGKNNNIFNELYNLMNYTDISFWISNIM